MAVNAVGWPPTAFTLQAGVPIGQLPVNAVATDAFTYTVTEGNTVTVQVTCANKPTANVVVTSSIVFNTQTPTVSINAGGTLTFTTGNFSTPQNLVLNGLVGNDGNAYVVLSGAGADGAVVPQLIQVSCTPL